MGDSPRAGLVAPMIALVSYPSSAGHPAVSAGRGTNVGSREWQ